MIVQLSRHKITLDAAFARKSAQYKQIVAGRIYKVLQGLLDVLFKTLRQITLI
jgi:hypothetical protein